MTVDLIGLFSGFLDDNFSLRFIAHEFIGALIFHYLSYSLGVKMQKESPKVTKIIRERNEKNTVCFDNECGFSQCE